MLALSWGRVSLNDQVFLSLPLFLVSICWNPFSRLKSEWILKLFRRASLLTGSSPHPPCGLWDPSCSSLFSSSLYHVPFSPSPWFPWSSHTEWCFISSQDLHFLTSEPLHLLLLLCKWLSFTSLPNELRKAQLSVTFSLWAPPGSSCASCLLM